VLECTGPVTTVIGAVADRFELQTRVSSGRRSSLELLAKNYTGRTEIRSGVSYETPFTPFQMGTPTHDTNKFLQNSHPPWIYTCPYNK